jgi:type III secretory pathway component EscS
MSAQATLKLQLRRVGWLVLIWALSVLALAVVAGLFRGLMTLAGMTV